jgi:hypothetical protein
MGAVAWGRAEVFVNGEFRRTKKNVRAFGIGKVRRSPVVEDQNHGYIEEAVAPGIEFSETAFDGVSLTDLAALTNATIQFRSIGSDKTLILRNAFCQADLEVTSGEAGATGIIFFGLEWQEQN